MIILDKEDKDFEFSDNYFLYLINNNICFDSEDIAEFIDRYEIKRNPQEPRRWSRWVECICKIQDRYFITGYDQGLTEYQEDEYYDNEIIEVQPIETIKQIAVTYWVNKEGRTICETINNG